MDQSCSKCPDLISVLSTKPRQAVSSTPRCWPWHRVPLPSSGTFPVPAGPAQTLTHGHQQGLTLGKRGVLPFAEITSRQPRSLCLAGVSFFFLCYKKLSIENELLVFAAIAVSAGMGQGKPKDAAAGTGTHQGSSAHPGVGETLAGEG